VEDVVSASRTDRDTDALETWDAIGVLCAAGKVNDYHRFHRYTLVQALHGFTLGPGALKALAFHAGYRPGMGHYRHAEQAHVADEFYAGHRFFDLRRKLLEGGWKEPKDGKACWAKGAAYWESKRASQGAGNGFNYRSRSDDRPEPGPRPRPEPRRLTPRQTEACIVLDLPTWQFPGEDELRRAYRSAAAQAHPDAGGTTEEFLRVKAAYDCLSDVVSKNPTPTPPAEDDDQPPF
jgi:hypothetical protein